jgi:hypothetical protein
METLPSHLQKIEASRLKAKRQNCQSKITVPEKGHPLARLAFRLMQKQGVTYDELEWCSGVLRCTIKSWRHEKKPGLETIQAVLGALGFELVPVPALDSLPAHVRDIIEDVGEHFRSDSEALGAAIAAAAAMPAITAAAMANMAADRAAGKRGARPRGTQPSRNTFEEAALR